MTSIGRKYNINGRELARYNNLDYDRGIQIGQTLRIPVRGDFNTGGAGNPIYHTVLPKETLYSISLKYNKIPIETLKRWNNLQSDALQEGMRLIVSYSEASSSIPASSIPVTASQPAPKAAPQSPPPVQQAATVPTPQLPETTGTFAGGFFKSLFTASSGNKLEGRAGTFKSTSGWDDGKYYCLHNSATAGSIVKVTNKANGKVVYAKVLDVIPDLKQNANLVLRLSNAAADELEANSSTFDVIVEF